MVGGSRESAATAQAPTVLTARQGKPLRIRILLHRPTSHGLYQHRYIVGGIGHNLLQEDPTAFLERHRRRRCLLHRPYLAMWCASAIAHVNDPASKDIGAATALGCVSQNDNCSETASGRALTQPDAMTYFPVTQRRLVSRPDTSKGPVRKGLCERAWLMLSTWS